MLWIYCGLFLFSVVAQTGFASAAAAFASKREADYTLDDSFWNEESPVGEVERLLREYRQNQKLVQNIGAHYYQIIYPVQLRHHEKMGISTREVGAPKVRKARSTFPSRNYPKDGGNYQGTRERNRNGNKHYHRTSLLIKAFNHKFRLDLELNTQLLAPNLMQKHYLASGAEQISKQEIEHCYYHGTVKDYPGASAAFHTCNGVSGVIHVGNETFVIHPFYGGDLSKHPHVIFEARTKANKGCANSGNLNWGKKRRQKHLNGLTEESEATQRSKRDVREATKYIETAIVIDKAMFDKRNGSTRAEVVHDAIQVANIADLYFRTLNTRVSVVYIETWQGQNQAQILKNEDISRSLYNFNDYTSRKLFKVDKDTTQLLTGEAFQGGEAGMAVPETVCTSKSVGISVDINTYEPHLLAGTMAHMIGHNIGMGHDDGREECFCRDWHGCIMAQSIVGLENVQPYKFSECSLSDYIDALRIGHGICLLNKPNELEVRRTCGNRVVEEGEDCDCGTIDECHEMDPCCDPITCKLTKESECATGPCCENCRLREQGVICRDAKNECDLPEHCSGEHGQCPTDIWKKNGISCGADTGYCFNGVCPTLNIQCEQIWGPGGISADTRCFEQFNSKGSINGHCGIDNAGHYFKCAKENVRCGSLQCQLGNRYPVIAGMDEMFSRTIISIKGIEYECKATNGTLDHVEIPELGLVRDGTPCGDNLICVNQTCTSIFPHIDQGKCPSNHNNRECSGHGFCTNINKCYCEMGWSGPDCSIELEITMPPLQSTSAPTPADPDKDKTGLAGIMKKNITPYGANNTDNLSTLSMVFIMVGVVKGVFICFALMAVCYRKSTVPKYEPPYVKKPISKKYAPSASNHSQEDLVDANKILINMPTFSRADSQRVVYRPTNHLSGSIASHLQEHKMAEHMKRMAAGSGSEEDPTHSGEEEAVSFIDLQHNNLSKLPEKKGILKKHGGYGLVMADSNDKWGEDSRSVLSQSDNNIGEMMSASSGGTGTASMAEVERTLKSLNGYHEDILEALRNAASHRGATATPSGSSSLLSDEILRKTLQDCSTTVVYQDYPNTKRISSKENICDQTHTVMVENSPSRLHIHQPHQQPDEDEDDEVPPCGPIRIRNLEDLIRQLEHHSRHMSPSGSEDIRMSETEADRHYRLDSSSACSESSQSQSRCRGRGDDETRFVYGRYRQPTSGRHQYPHPQHHHHSHQHMAEEESIYETADHDRGADQCGDIPDSESDEFIQAQQQLVRWASEEAVSKAGVCAGQGPGPSSSSSSGMAMAMGIGSGSNGVCIGGIGNIGQRDYFPSPVSSESEESGGEGNSIVRAPPSSQLPHLPPPHQLQLQQHQHPHQLVVGNGADSDNDSPIAGAGPSAASVAEQTALLSSSSSSSRPQKRYPEYKH